MRLRFVLLSRPHILPVKGAEAMQAEARAVLPRNTRSILANKSSKGCVCAGQEQVGERMPPDAPCVDGKIVRGPNGGPSHKQTGSRGRLSCALDDAIVTLFEEERRTRGLTISKLVSIILWNRYGCPKLSFEK